MLLFYIFPTSRFLNRRWFWAGWLAGLAVGALVLGAGFANEVGPDGADWAIANPIGFLDTNGVEDGVFVSFLGCPSWPF
ncbi:MAG: hypothetical protein WBM90_04310 [Acidimicrobiia bacterium]